MYIISYVIITLHCIKLYYIIHVYLFIVTVDTVFPLKSAKQFALRLE